MNEELRQFLIDTDKSSHVLWANWVFYKYHNGTLPLEKIDVIYKNKDVQNILEMVLRDALSEIKKCNEYKQALQNWHESEDMAHG